jgi:hypothetical protein
MTREEAARRFAELAGWKLRPLPRSPAYVPTHFETDPGSHTGGERIDFPLQDAPLHEHLEFVGRIAEAVGHDRWYISTMDDPRGFMVQFVMLGGGSAPDLSHAALLAGIAALEARRADR